MHTGMFVYCGKKATLSVGNVKPVGDMPEGTLVCNVEEKPGDRGTVARASGNYATIIAHNRDTGKTRVRLPSGNKKVLPSQSRAMVGIVAGGGRTDKPLLSTYHLLLPPLQRLSVTVAAAAASSSVICVAVRFNDLCAVYYLSVLFWVWLVRILCRLYVGGHRACR